MQESDLRIVGELQVCVDHAGQHLCGPRRPCPDPALSPCQWTMASVRRALASALCVLYLPATPGSLDSRFEFE